MKRGGWDEGSRDIDGEAKKGPGSKLVTSETEATLTPGMVVVNENNDTLVRLDTLSKTSLLGEGGL